MSNRLSKYNRALPINPDIPIKGGGRPGGMNLIEYIKCYLSPLYVQELFNGSQYKYYKLYKGSYYNVSMIYQVDPELIKSMRDKWRDNKTDNGVSK